MRQRLLSGSEYFLNISLLKGWRCSLNCSRCCPSDTKMKGCLHSSYVTCCFQLTWEYHGESVHLEISFGGVLCSSHCLSGIDITNALKILSVIEKLSIVIRFSSL